MLRSAPLCRCASARFMAKERSLCGVCDRVHGLERRIENIENNDAMHSTWRRGSSHQLLDVHHGIEVSVNTQTTGMAQVHQETVRV